MKHFQSISKTTVPARATELIEWAQIGTIFSTFLGAIGVLATAFNTFTTAFNTKGTFDE